MAIALMIFWLNKKLFEIQVFNSIFKTKIRVILIKIMIRIVYKA